MAVTLRLGQTAHLYLRIYVTYSRTINLPATSQNKRGGPGGGSGVCMQAHISMMWWFMRLDGGWGAPGSGCIQRAEHWASGALYESTCMRLQHVWLGLKRSNPALLIWLSPGNPRRADKDDSFPTSRPSRPPRRTTAARLDIRLQT